MDKDSAIEEAMGQDGGGILIEYRSMGMVVPCNHVRQAYDSIAQMDEADKRRTHRNVRAALERGYKKIKKGKMSDGVMQAFLQDIVIDKAFEYVAKGEEPLHDGSEDNTYIATCYWTDDFVEFHHNVTYAFGASWADAMRQHQENAWDLPLAGEVWLGYFDSAGAK